MSHLIGEHQLTPSQRKLLAVVLRHMKVTPEVSTDRIGELTRLLTRTD